MRTNTNKIFPIIITIIIIIIIIYLFATIKQPYIECSRTTTNDLDIKILEKLNSTLEGNKIKKMELTKTIILPEKYLQDDNYLDSIEFSLEKSYDYLGQEIVEISKTTDRVIVKISVEEEATIILNNIEFFDQDGLQMKINSNTKSSDVIALSIGDQYSEGKFMIRMRNNGYSCK